jgi:hypothetical protein
MNFFNPWKPCTGMRQNAKNKRKKKKEKRKGADQRGQLFYYSTEKLLSVLDEVAAALARAQLWR